MTYLELVNNVLTRLREPMITSVDKSEDAVVNIVKNLVNDAKRHVEMAHSGMPPVSCGSSLLSLARLAISSRTPLGLSYYWSHGERQSYPPVGLEYADTPNKQDRAFLSLCL